MSHVSHIRKQPDMETFLHQFSKLRLRLYQIWHLMHKMRTCGNRIRQTRKRVNNIILLVRTVLL